MFAEHVPAHVKAGRADDPANLGERGRGHEKSDERSSRSEASELVNTVLDRLRTQPASSALTPHIEQQIDGQRDHGRPLPIAVHRQMSAAFGRDLGDVDIHTDSAAARLARGVGARAFTMGSSIFFGAGEYAPSTPRGDRVLGHELAHVVQHQQAPDAHAGVIHRLTDDEIDAALEDLSPDTLPEGLVKALVDFTVEWQNRSSDTFARLRRATSIRDALSSLALNVLVEFLTCPAPAASATTRR